MKISQTPRYILAVLLALTACSGPTKTTEPEPAKPAVKTNEDSNGVLKPTQLKKEEIKTAEAPPPLKPQTFVIPVIKEEQDGEAHEDESPQLLSRSVKGKEQNDWPGDAVAAPFDAAGSDNTVYEKVEVEAFFRGGNENFIDYVKENFQYPSRCTEEGINGYVLLRFVVDKNGRISQIKALEETAACLEFTQEAIRVTKRSPPWIPAQINGKSVSSYRTIPIRLDLE
ncbi:MAG: TonB family protein [Bacteroidetes bacterium]|nr:TonB family protein [Bacteroidota bacterium]